MDSGSKRKHRPRKKRINIETVSKAPEEENESSSKTNENINKDKPSDSATDSQEKDSEQSQSTAAASRQSGASSPEPNCAICLGKLENKSFTDSCFHTFCFVCLVEWSKVKAECPLCKQSFKSIVHNVRSYEDYDQYQVQNAEEQNSHVNQFRSLLDGVRFRYRTTVTDHRYAHIAERLDQELQNRLLQRPSRRVPIPNWRRIRQPANSDFRRSIYLQRLKQKTEHINTRRRVRETSPSFYRENAAQTHRLVPWLNRELNALLHGHGEQTAFVLDLIMGLVKRYAIDSEEFYQHVYPFVGRHTRQFMQEFLQFAKSPYHMAAYDRHVAYEANNEPRHDSDSDSDHNAPGAVDDGNDSDVVVVSPDNSFDHRNNPAAAPPRAESGLDPWERSIMTVGNPSYLGFQPIVRSYGHENLSQGLDMRNPYLRIDLPPSASGWDSPTPGPSSIFDDCQISSSNSLTMALSAAGIGPLTATSSTWTPSASSYSAPITPLQTRTDSTDNLIDPLHVGLPSILPGTLVSSNTQSDAILCHETDSDSDEVMIVDYEKPWNDRSPIQLSSAANDSDSDLVITGMSYVESPVKKEKKKHKHKKRDQRDKDRAGSKERGRKRSGPLAEPTRPKKRRKKSKSNNISKPRAERSRSRSLSTLPNSPGRISSRSRSPIRIRLYNDCGYKHKKFGSNYREEARQHDLSSSATLTDSDHGSEIRHVSYTSHKHLDRRHASIEMLEYRKKSSKHRKKNKKQKKDSKSKAHKNNNESDDDEEFESRERMDSDLSKTHRHHKSKKKRSKHKNQKHKEKRLLSPEESEHDENRKKNLPSKQVLTVNSDGSVSSRVSHVARLFKEIAELKQQTGQETSNYTSDSDSDSEDVIAKDKIDKNESARQVTKSNIDNEGNKDEHTEEALKSADVDKLIQISERETVGDESKLDDTLFQNNGVEFVELSQDQTANIDLELASIAKDLTYSSEDATRPRQFKKHPYGHKKSGKSSNCVHVPVHDGAVDLSLVSALQANCSPRSAPYLGEDNIQSNDVSSCTDLENILHTGAASLDKTDLLGYNQQDKSIVNANCELIPKRHSISSILNKGLADNESLTSSAFTSPSKQRRTAQDFVNVETLSDCSDIDIVGESSSDCFLAVQSYKTSSTSLKLSDLTGVHAESAVAKTDENRAVSCEIQEEIDVTGVSDTESIVECIGEEHLLLESDTDDSDSYIEVLHNDSDNYVDVLGNSDEEIIIGDEEVEENKKSRRNKFTIISESDSTDLDYHCDNEEETEDKKFINETGNCSDITALDGDVGGPDGENVKVNIDQTNLVDEKVPGKSVEEKVNEVGSSKNTEIDTDLCSLQGNIQCDNIRDESLNVAVKPGSSCDTQSLPISFPATTSMSTDTSCSHNEEYSHLQESSNDEQSNVSGSEGECQDDNFQAFSDTKVSHKSNVQEKTDTDPSDNPLLIKSSTNDMTDLSITNKTNTSVSGQPSTCATEQAPSQQPVTTSSPHLNWSSLFNSGVITSSTSVSRQFIPTVYEPRSPLFESSPEYEQFLPRSPVFDEFSPAESDLSEENFVPED